MNRANDDRMYYTDGGGSTGNMSSGSMSNGNSMYGGRMGRSGTTMSRYDTARRNYTETKAVHNSNSAEDNQENMRQLEKFIDEVKADVRPLVANMSDSEKNLLRNKLDTAMNSVL